MFSFHCSVEISLVQGIRKCYGLTTVKLLRAVEKLDFRRRKAKLDEKFLIYRVEIVTSFQSFKILGLLTEIYDRLKRIARVRYTYCVRKLGLSKGK